MLHCLYHLPLLWLNSPGRCVCVCVQGDISLRMCGLWNGKWKFRCNCACVQLNFLDLAPVKGPLALLEVRLPLELPRRAADFHMPPQCRDSSPQTAGGGPFSCFPCFSRTGWHWLFFLSAMSGPVFHFPRSQKVSGGVCSCHPNAHLGRVVVRWGWGGDHMVPSVTFQQRARGGEPGLQLWRIISTF